MITIQKIKSIAVASFIALQGYAQINTSMMYDPHFTAYASRYLPGRLGTNPGLGEVNMFNIYGYVSSNSVGFNTVKDFILSDQITDEQIGTIIGQMKKDNRIFVGAEVQILSLAFRIKNKDKKELFALKIDARDRVYGSLQYNKNTFKLLLEGNKQFAGQTLSLSDSRLNASYQREYGLGFSVPVAIDVLSKTLTIRPAATMKFIQGMANVSMPKGKASVYTEQDGRYLDFEFDYLANTAIPNDIGGIFKGSGLGWGLDLGVNINWRDFIIVDAGVVDLGRVYYNKNMKNYGNSGKHRYDGLEAQLFQDGEANAQIDAEQMKEVFAPKETADKYTTTLGTKLIFQTEVRLQKRERKTKKDKENIYYRHRLFATYVQGVENAYAATTSPYFSLGYTYSFRNILNMGLNLGFNGYNTVNFGPFLSVKGGPFVFGLGSNNLCGLMGKKGSGVDGYFDIGFNF